MNYFLTINDEFKMMSSDLDRVRDALYDHKHERETGEFRIEVSWFGPEEGAFQGIIWRGDLADLMVDLVDEQDVEFVLYRFKTELNPLWQWCERIDRV